MEIERRIREWVTESLEVTSIKLMSVEEYKTAKAHIMPIKGWWWLRSPGGRMYYAALVKDSGRVSMHGDDVSYTSGVVRPALEVSNLKSFILNPEDKIIDLAGHDWTVISDTMVLCDDGIGEHCFREEWNAPDANNYEKSDVKRYLESWAEENGIIICGKKVEEQDES